MAKFLTGDVLSEEIKRVLNGRDCRCAVAFWGRGAKQALFGGKKLARSTRIICEIGMGGTNPLELGLLGAPTNKAVRHARGLHAKIYLSDRGAIVGSANASENGIGFSAGAGLVEAGIFLRPTSAAFAEAKAWVHALFYGAEVVDQSALDLCAEAWRRRSKADGVQAGAERRPKDKSLLEAVWANPERFRGVGFVFTNGRTTQADRDIGASAVLAQDQNLDRPLLTDDDRSDLAGWPVGHVFSGWAKEDVSGWPERFICAHRGRSRIRYWLYNRRYTTFHEETGGMVFATLNGEIKRELGLKGGLDTLGKTDAKLLAQIFAEGDETGHRLYVNGAELAPVIDRLRS